MKDADIERITTALQSMQFVCEDLKALVSAEGEPFLGELALGYLQQAVDLKNNLQRLESIAQEQGQKHDPLAAKCLAGEVVSVAKVPEP